MASIKYNFWNASIWFQFPFFTGYFVGIENDFPLFGQNFIQILLICLDKLYNRYELTSGFQFVVNNRMRKDSSQQQEVGRNRDKIVHRFI